MLFNSLEFLVFWTAVLGLYHGPVQRCSWDARKWFLVVVSYLFYAAFSPQFSLLLVAATLLDFGIALRLERTQGAAQRRALLTISVAANLGMLGFFKYGGFVAENWSVLVGGDPALADLILPIGISFYTFESLSYTIDVYRGAPACRRLLDFALFLAFFPHLVAGPIVRPRAFLPQLLAPTGVSWRVVEHATARIGQGLIKKMLLADSLGIYVDSVWAGPGNLPWQGGPPIGNVLLAIYAYAFQIYFDFSGYTDIALGLAQCLGFELPENFDRPYAARNPREFWQRWHISLSTWLRDYLYVALGGNRLGARRTYVNLFLTLLLGGFWHGPAWNFVLWGVYHGAWSAGHRWWVARRPAHPGRWRDGAKRLATFHGVALGWVLFRMPSLTDGWRLGLGALRFGYQSSWAGTVALAITGLAVGLHAGPMAWTARRRFVAWPPLWQGVAYGAAAMAIFLFAPSNARFIYFQF